MSGLKNEPVSSGKYLNFKDGKIISAVDGEKKEYTAIEGKLIELDIIDSVYEKKEYRKISLEILDDEGNTWKLGFPLESGYGKAFCSIAPNIDYHKVVKISGGIKEMEGGGKYGMIFVRQPDENGEMKTVKWFYTKDHKDLPPTEKKRDRSGEFTDYSLQNDFFQKLLIETIRPAILGSLNGVSKSESKPKETKKTK